MSSQQVAPHSRHGRRNRDAALAPRSHCPCTYREPLSFRWDATPAIFWHPYVARDRYRLPTSMSSSPSQMSEAALHSAGATVRHSSPFSELEVPVSEQPISREFIETWVRPFYMLDIGDVPAVDAVVGPVAQQI